MTSSAFKRTSHCGIGLAVGCAALFFGCSSDDVPGPDGANAAGTGATSNTAGTSVGGSVANSGSGGTAGSQNTAGTGGGSSGATGGAETGGGGAATAGNTTGGTDSASGGGGAGGIEPVGGGGMAAGGDPTGGMGGAAGGMDGGGGMGGSGGSGEFTLTAPWDSDEGCSDEDRDPCGRIPAQYTMVQGNPNQMPELSWTPGPDGTQSYALVYHDHSFQQGGMPFVHWAMWNIPADVTSIAADMIPSDVEQGSFQGGGWAGSGACGNVYELLLYALSDPTLDASDQTDVRNTLRDADDTLVLASDNVLGETGPPECTP